jgi:ISXO2-like transposase domain
VVVAAHLVATQHHGISAVQLQRQRQLGIGRYETAWVMLHKLRRAMVAPEREPLTRPVEVDEFYVRGIEEGRGAGRKSDSSKAIVAAAVELRGTGSGRLRVGVVSDLSADSLCGFVTAVVDASGRAHGRMAGQPAAESRGP